MKERKKISQKKAKEMRQEYSTCGTRLKREVFKRDNHECQKCGFSPDRHYVKRIETIYGTYEAPRLEVDHIVPIIYGGSNSMRNLQALCFFCNQTKKDKIGNDWNFTRRHINHMMFLDYDIRKKKALKRITPSVKRNK